MKHKIRRVLAGLLAITLLTCPALAASPFPDVDENAEYAEAVEYLNQIEIMVGDAQGNFNPNKTVTRAEMATIICRMLGETDDLPSSTAFTDVPVGHWANAYVGKAAELGIVSGYGDGRFGPSDIVTYEQALTMLFRTMDLSAEAESAGGYPIGYIKLAKEYGYTVGVFANTGDLLNRWQIAQLVYNFSI